MTSSLPVHLLTIVRSGQPSLCPHVVAFGALPFPWHGHVVEGVAALARAVGRRRATRGPA